MYLANLTRDATICVINTLPEEHWWRLKRVCKSLYYLLKKCYKKNMHINQLVKQRCYESIIGLGYGNCYITMTGNLKFIKHHIKDITVLKNGLRMISAYGDIECAEYAISCGDRISDDDIYISCLNRNFALTDYFISKYPNYDKTTLAKAASFVGEMRYIDINNTPNRSVIYTGLFASGNWQNNLEFINANAGNSVNAWQAAMAGAIANFDERAIAYILSKIETIDWNEYSTAACKGGIAAINFLKSKGVESFACGLDIACKYSRLDVIDYLLEHEITKIHQSIFFRGSISALNESHVEVIKKIIKYIDKDILDFIILFSQKLKHPIISELFS